MKVLLDLGFIPVLGTRDGLYEGQVKRGKPLHWDANNGVIAVYDRDGSPWIIKAEQLTDEQLADLIKQLELRYGAFVPHSNGGHFESIRLGDRC